MPTIELSTLIAAPIERVFDLARSIDLHSSSMSNTGERAVGGVTTGLIGLGEEVTWRARHLGIRQTLTSRIIACERPVHFADAMLRGAFHTMEHHHYFEAAGESGTVMRDVFTFASPLGILGRIMDAVFLKNYMRRFLVQRNDMLKATAESDDWKQYLPG